MALDTAKGLNVESSSAQDTDVTDGGAEVGADAVAVATFVPEPAATYEEELNSLIDAVGQMVQVIMADQVNEVKQALMDQSVTELAVFFGKTKGNFPIVLRSRPMFF